MSTGGSFYVLSDEELEQLLDDGEEGFEAFMHDSHEREYFSEQEWYWYELTELLDDEGVRGELADFAEDVGCGVGYAFAEDVRIIAEALSRLTDEDIGERFEDMRDIMGRMTLEEMLELVKGLSAFYQKASKNGAAILFVAMS
ncbi:uncharacterized protein DUF1877 [Fluviicoccus keumensis]|uniref:Uncharacterized protein DUF1877 n=1 Tax=Fluviicoccus keumensis TaxID=1435465 RepID=A0A4V2G3W8_9GAMM|nr:DUF1877 family protein [Fluviicoccus keumensis]RZU38626.1 uncharacterized protein DUF1877 [Fluviicoccus keumensis]